MIGHRFKRLLKAIQWLLVHRRYESIYFFTLHKCASTLFSDFVLQNVCGLTHVDYADMIYLDRPPARLDFAKSGYIYGPIRISAFRGGPVYQQLVQPVTDSGFIGDKRVVLFVRDPRDIIVSQYYSFGFSHGISPVPEISRLQLAGREQIQSQSLDEYALSIADETLAHFQELECIASQCARSTVLRYEDMIEKFDTFARQIREVFDITDETIDELFERSRPVEVEDPTSHRRSGRCGAYRDKLQPETIGKLNQTLAPALQRFGYDV